MDENTKALVAATLAAALTDPNQSQGNAVAPMSRQQKVNGTVSLFYTVLAALDDPANKPS